MIIASHTHTIVIKMWPLVPHLLCLSAKNTYKLYPLIPQFHRQMSMRKTISMNDFNPPKVEIAPSLDTSRRVHDLTRSLSVVPSQLASARKVTRAGSMGSILGEQSLSHSSRRRSSDASDKGRSLVNKKVDKLLKAVTDGDINMVGQKLGLE